MIRRSLAYAAALAALLLLAVTARYDLGLAFARLATSHLATGDIEGARSLQAKAAALGGDGPRLAYNLGVALYARGDYAAAEQAFAAAAAGRATAASAHYNRGNALFRMSVLLPANDPTALRYLRDAVAEYKSTVGAEPDAADAAANLALATARLAVLARASATSLPGGGRNDGERNGRRTEDRGNGGKPISVAGAGQAQPSTDAGGAPPTADARQLANIDRAVPANRFAEAPELAGVDVERMLSEARKRELRSGAALQRQRHDAPPRPDRDW